MLAECTGYDAVSLQPNAGSQGEYAGLLAIKRYHESRGDRARDICLIPASAHGTNPASAVLAGMRVVIVACDEHGNVDVDDLRARPRSTRHLAAIMVTYPSTHGVFEEDASPTSAPSSTSTAARSTWMAPTSTPWSASCRPGHFGADVCHLNLHKTFCIPHGGGGPGMGPIGVRAHLQPFLPSHPVVPVPGLAAGNDVGLRHALRQRLDPADLLAYIALMGGRA
jgi:glycine dehydrogenase